MLTECSLELDTTNEKTNTWSTYVAQMIGFDWSWYILGFWRVSYYKTSSQAQSYASLKLLPSDLLTGVKCRATSVAKKLIFFFILIHLIELS